MRERRIDNPADAIAQVIRTYSQTRQAENMMRQKMLEERMKQDSGFEDFAAKERFKDELVRKRQEEMMGNIDQSRFKPKGISPSGGVSYEYVPTEQERSEEAQRYAEKETMKGEAMASRERLKKKKQAEVDFQTARNKLRVTSAAFQAMQERAGGAGPVGAAKAWFGGTKAGRMMGVNPYTKAYEGQLVEAASSLAKLASPSARVGKDMIENFKETLPDVWSIANPGEFYSQIRFSLHNAFGTALANAEQEYSPEIRAMVDSMVDELVETPSMTMEDVERLNKGLSIDAERYLPKKQQEGTDEMSGQEVQEDEDPLGLF